MPGEHLREVLDELHEELERTGPVDESVRQRLREITLEIGELLERSREEPGAAAEGQSLADRLKESVGHFEEDHPTLSSIVGRLVEALGRTIT